jgi:hypothetical protein
VACCGGDGGGGSCGGGGGSGSEGWNGGSNVNAFVEYRKKEGRKVSIVGKKGCIVEKRTGIVGR